MKEAFPLTYPHHSKSISRASATNFGPMEVQSKRTSSLSVRARSMERSPGVKVSAAADPTPTAIRTIFPASSIPLAIACTKQSPQHECAGRYEGSSPQAFVPTSTTVAIARGYPHVWIGVAFNFVIALVPFVRLDQRGAVILIAPRCCRPLTRLERDPLVEEVGTVRPRVRDCPFTVSSAATRWVSRFPPWTVLLTRVTLPFASRPVNARTSQTPGRRSRIDATGARTRMSG